MTTNNRTCKYTLRIVDRAYRYDRDAKEFKAVWSRYVKLCESLDKGGFTFTVKVEYHAPSATIVLRIAGVADRLKPVRKPARRARASVAKVSLEKCQKMVAETKRAALEGSIVPMRRVMSRWEYDLQTRERDRIAGHLIARAKARGESTVDVTPMFPNTYQSVIRSNVQTMIAERKRHHYDAAPVDAHQAREARLLALAEYKHWREMELLSGTREQFKPGLTDETFYADDEVAA